MEGWRDDGWMGRWKDAWKEEREGKGREGVRKGR